MTFMTFTLPAVSYEQARDNWVADYWAGQERTSAQQPAGQSAKVTDEQWAQMSNAQRLDYCRQHPQQPLDHGRRR
jgi:hypothetical protein